MSRRSAPPTTLLDITETDVNREWGATNRFIHAFMMHWIQMIQDHGFKKSNDINYIGVCTVSELVQDVHRQLRQSPNLRLCRRVPPAKRLWIINASNHFSTILLDHQSLCVLDPLGGLGVARDLSASLTSLTAFYPELRIVYSLVQIQSMSSKLCGIFAATCALFCLFGETKLILLAGDGGGGAGGENDDQRPIAKERGEKDNQRRLKANDQRLLDILHQVLLMMDTKFHNKNF